MQTPNQVPDVPDYVLGVLTVRGQILPVIDLRRLLHQRSLADEFADNCRPLREEYERGLDQVEKIFADGWQGKVEPKMAERLRTWLAETNSSSQLLMETLAQARGLNEMVIKQLQLRLKHQEHGDRDAASACGEEAISGGRKAVAALLRFEGEIGLNIKEDQRIIVVDAEGFVLGLVVDHVHEVLNVPTNLMEPPPRITSNGGMELSGVAKLDDGSRLIMLLDVASLMKDQKLRNVQESSVQSVDPEHAAETQKTAAGCAGVERSSTGHVHARRRGIRRPDFANSGDRPPRQDHQSAQGRGVHRRHHESARGSDPRAGHAEALRTRSQTAGRPHAHHHRGSGRRQNRPGGGFRARGAESRQEGHRPAAGGDRDPESISSSFPESAKWMRASA